MTEASSSAAEVLPSPIPDKEDNLFYDLRDLTVFDISPIHPKGGDLLKASRDNVQLLVNRIFSLEGREKTDDGILVKLPRHSETEFKLPREKPLPKDKPKTRWQQFAEQRGIQKKKRSRMVWDENMKDWVPRYGYKSVKQNAKKLEWAIETKPGDDLNVNPFEKRAAEHALVKAKQKMREIRNKMEAAGKKVPAGISGGPQNPKSNDTKVKRGKENLAEVLRRAQSSSASMGDFDRKAKNESDAQRHRTKITHLRTASEEKEKNMKAVERILSGEYVVDKKKAARFGQADSQRRGGKSGVKKGRKGKKGTLE